MAARALTTTLDGRNLAYENLGDILILGAGVSAQAVIDYLREDALGRWTSITVYAGPRTDGAVAFFETRTDVQVIYGAQHVEGAFDLAIASPGISALSDFYMSARQCSTELISEVEFAYRESDISWKWIGVTGSNGKTTTTALTAHLLAHAGFESVAVGNIGRACIRVVGDFLARRTALTKPIAIVCELSSYQLASISKMAVDVAIILGITPDHLSWHGSFEAYRDAKFNLLKGLGSKRAGVAILDAVNDVVREKVRELRPFSLEERGFAYIPIGTRAGIEGDMRQACGADHAAFINPDGVFTVAWNGREYTYGRCADMLLKGVHNQLNALAALACSTVLGADGAALVRALDEFKPLEHRIEPVGEVKGIAFFNDSKATNVDSTLTGLAAMDQGRCVVMLGGRDKHTELDDLVEGCAHTCKAVVCFGEAGERFARALGVLREQGIEVLLEDTFDEAFARACRCARPGDSVLLSPACSSFDEFTCFEERGAHFKELVRNLGATR